MELDCELFLGQSNLLSLVFEKNANFKLLVAHIKLFCKFRI